MFFTTSGQNLIAQKPQQTAPRQKGDNLAAAGYNRTPLFTNPHTLLALREWKAIKKKADSVRGMCVASALRSALLETMRLFSFLHGNNMFNAVSEECSFTLEPVSSIEPVLSSSSGWGEGRGALSARLMKAGRQAFREEPVCSTAWQSQPPSISIIHIHMPVGREQLLRERTRGRWHGCGGGGGEGGTACQTPITVVPSSCSSSTCACQSCVKEWEEKRHWAKIRQYQ